MNPALLIFTQIAIAGCGFLVYFLYALWRDSLKRSKVTIRRVSTAPREGEVVPICAPNEFQTHRDRATS